MPFPLFFEDGKSTSPLPLWAQFYLALGEEIGSRSRSNRRTVVALSVPTRIFCAPLLGAGVVVQRASIAAADTRQAAFQAIASMPCGSPISFISDQGTGKFNGQLSGMRISDGKLQVAITVHYKKYGSATHWFDSEQAHRLRIPEARGRITQDIHGQPISAANFRFIGPLIAPAVPMEFAHASSLDVLFVGSLHTLDHELRSEKLRSEAPDQPGFRKGVLQDLVRTKRFLRGDQSYRSELVTSRVGRASYSLDPHVVIFDGANNYLRLHGRWAKSHHIVVLDRTDRMFNEAAETLKQDFLTRPADGNIVQPSLPVPEGVELFIFWR